MAVARAEELNLPVLGDAVPGRFPRRERVAMRNMFQKYGPKLGAGSLVGGLGSAFAAVPTEVTTAITDMKADGLVVAAAVLVAIIAIAAVKFIRKGL